MVSDNVFHDKNVPDWFKKYTWDRVPKWYQNVLKQSGDIGDDGLPRPTPTPDEVNQELTSNIREEQIQGPLMKNIKLPGVGAGYRQSQVVNWSYYNKPIDVDRDIRGRSRKWGDIDDEAKQQVISRITEQARGAGLSPDDTAYVLAIAHVESGFNPDAAAGTTSAHGLGQFINKTGEHYGLGDANRWDIDTQIKALIDHFKDNKRMAEGKGKDYIYAYHHDGPSLAYGGIDIAKRKVRPLYEMYKSNLV